MIIDLNCDLGESSEYRNTGYDEAIMPWITSANIACGFHAGDPLTMLKTIKLALEHDVSIGAHPGYPDRKGFGRAEMLMDREELMASILYQVGALRSMTETSGGRLNHVKPHGALYNKAVKDPGTADIIVKAVKETDNTLILFGLAGSELQKAANRAGLPFASEVFADRAYNDDGTLVSRNSEGAVLRDTRHVIERAIRMIREKTIETVSGKQITVRPDTICVHGDHEMAVSFVRSLVLAFREKGILTRAFTGK